MGNLALHSAEEPGNLRATTGTVEVPTKRDNDVALAPGARPSQQHENAARHITAIDAVGIIACFTKHRKIHGSFLGHGVNTALFRTKFQQNID